MHAVSTQEITQQLGRYELLSELGQGAMGVVYKARDPVLDRVVAVKTINLTLPKDELSEYEARFYQEARAAGGLNHPNIVTIYDIGKSERVAYMAMEFLEGEELRSVLSAREPLPVELALDVAAQVADGLAYAHDRHIVHRDIKPANIMVVRDGLVKITDFGIARMRTNEVKTMTGMILGSPKYMSPEQVAGKRADHRSDLFSLGRRALRDAHRRGAVPGRQHPRHHVPDHAVHAHAAERAQPAAARRGRSDRRQGAEQGRGGALPGRARTWRAICASAATRCWASPPDRRTWPTAAAASRRRPPRHAAATSSRR